MEQRSVEWYEAHRGRITASEFDDVMRGRWEALRRRILRDREDIAASVPVELPEFEPAPLAWGHRHERAAVAYYELHRDVDTEAVGFVIHPGLHFVGCSPDRLVGGDGGLEIKCPFNETVHMSYLSIMRRTGSVPEDHVAQVQGSLWVTGREWWDFESFDSRRFGEDRAFIVRALPDAGYIARLQAAVLEFWHFVETGERRKADPVGSIPKLF